jgi:hypothetical protein
MISTSLKIFIDENEWDLGRPTGSGSGECVLDSNTSVSRLKAHFLETLESLGTLVRFSRADAFSNGPLAAGFAETGSLITSFHEPPPELPCRLLQHTKGGLMLPGGFLGAWTFRDATVNLVETSRQKTQLERAGGTLPFPLAVFAQRLATGVFFPKECGNGSLAASGALPSGRAKRIVYAGRLIPNKGITQLVRCLNLWPLSGVELTLIGAYEPDFVISQAGVSCPRFEHWFLREVLARNAAASVRILAPVSQTSLAEVFWNSDVFVYPSFHEDEASGNAAHEAVLSGLPAVVTDWCGLGQLGRNQRGGALPTYASLGGVRYSLHALREQIALVLDAERATDPSVRHRDADWVRATFDPHWMKNSVQAAIETLLARPHGPPWKVGWRCPERLHEIARCGPEPFRAALAGDSDTTPEELYVDGTGYEHTTYSEARFLAAIQGMYTTWPSPPRLRSGARLHGFWRVALWDQERALVEFGFPGPRVLRFSETAWRLVCGSARQGVRGEVAFEVRDSEDAGVLQKAVDFGILVPDDPLRCDFPEPNDTLPATG